MRPQEVADILGKTSAATRKIMTHMHADGEINRIKRGQYVHKDYQKEYEEQSKGCHNGHDVTINETVLIPKPIACDNVTDVTGSK